MFKPNLGLYSLLPSGDGDVESTRSRTGRQRPRLVVVLAFAFLCLCTIAAMGYAVFVKLSLTSFINCSKPPIRREWRSLGQAEKDSYILAAKCLYHTPSILAGEGSLLDDFTLVHLRIGQDIHDRASFLPWHRMFLHLYEQQLRELCGFQGQLPYWDWTSDWQNLTESSIWSNTLGFGSDGGKNTNDSCVLGPFTDVQVRYSANATVWPHCLSRTFLNYDSGDFGTISGELIKPEVIGLVKQVKDYGSFRFLLEGLLHNVIHHEILGDLSTKAAPNDPLFWLHHVQLDRLWWLWQNEDPEIRYKDYGDCSPGTRYEDYGECVEHSWEPASLQDKLNYVGLANEVVVKHVMRSDTDILCYRY